MYFGSKKGLGLDYLIPLFDGGGRTAAALDFFANVHNTSFSAEYWAWVKNQTMEKAIDFDGALVNPCHIESGVVGIPKTIIFPSEEEGPEVSTGNLPGLAAAVIKVQLQKSMKRVNVTVEGQPGFNNLAYKVYREGEAELTDGKPACQSLTDGERVVRRAEASDVLYVLIANTSPNASDMLAYTMTIAKEKP